MTYGIDKLVAGVHDPIGVARGKIPGVTALHKFGTVAAASTTAEDVWTPGGTYPGFLAAADTIVARAGGSANDADPVGSGANNVNVEGLNAAGELITDNISLAGASESSPTTEEFLRVFRAYVASVGTAHGSNDGDINLDTDGGTAVAQIAAGKGQTQMAIYTVPKDHKLVIRQVTASVAQGIVCAFELFTCGDILSGGGPVRVKDRVESGLGGSITKPYDPGFIVDELTDVWLAVTAASGTPAASGSFDGYLIDTRAAAY